MNLNQINEELIKIISLTDVEYLFDYMKFLIFFLKKVKNNFGREFSFLVRLFGNILELKD